jgi:hypothetical protein
MKCPLSAKAVQGGPNLDDVRRVHVLRDVFDRGRFPDLLKSIVTGELKSIFSS